MREVYPSVLNDRIIALQDVLAATESDELRIDIVKLKSLALEGIPDEGNLRPTIWKIFLKYQPLYVHKSSETMNEKRKTYYKYLLDLFNQSDTQNLDNSDHPLSENRNSKWNLCLKEKQILEQLIRDVSRTLSNIDYFRKKVPKSLTSLDIDTLGAEAKENCDNYIRNLLQSKEEQFSRGNHYNSLERLLFVYAKLNPGVGYIQGMNELVAPLYYVLANSEDYSAFHCEADTFWCFTELLSNLRDFYEKTLDHDSERGIKAILLQYTDRLFRSDSELANHLERLGVDPTYYVFRWAACLFSQDFTLPEVIHVWDFAFLNLDDINEFIVDFCVAMVVNIRALLLNSNFAEAVKTLQKYPDSDVKNLLYTYFHLKRRRQQPDFGKKGLSQLSKVFAPIPHLYHRLAENIHSQLESQNLEKETSNDIDIVSHLKMADEE